MKEQKSPKVSVVIATRDRAAVLELCLQHVMTQRDELLEVIVVDNSVDQQSTLAVVQRFPFVTYLRADPKRRNLALMRNLGIQASCGDILAFIDDDTLITSGWVHALVDAFADPEVGGVTGRVIEADVPIVCTTEIGRFSPRGEITMNFNNTIGRCVPVDFLYGCNMALRRSTIEIVGQFDPWFGMAYEETDLSFRIRRAKLRLMFVPGMTVQHLRAPRPPEIVQRSGSFDVRSMYMSCRSLAYLCVSHFGLRRDFAKVAFFNLPKGAFRSFLDRPSSRKLLTVSAIYIAGFVGYVMAFLRSLGLHSPPSLRDGQ